MSYSVYYYQFISSQYDNAFNASAAEVKLSIAVETCKMKWEFENTALPSSCWVVVSMLDNAEHNTHIAFHSNYMYAIIRQLREQYVVIYHYVRSTISEKM